MKVRIFVVVIAAIAASVRRDGCRSVRQRLVPVGGMRLEFARGQGRDDLRIERNEAGRLAITADVALPIDAPLTFSMTDRELVDYYTRSAAYAGEPGGSSTPWRSWLMLMSTHLEEAVYQAGKPGASPSIVIGATGFGPAPR